MKLSLFFFIACYVPIIGFTQTPNTEIVDFPEEPAQYYGGESAMNEFISKNIIYPEIAIEMEISGKCFIGFTINENGVISDLKVIKGVDGCPECDVEAMRVINLMPIWMPAKNKGQAVKSKYIIPINYMIVGRKHGRKKK